MDRGLQLLPAVRSVIDPLVRHIVIGQSFCPTSLGRLDDNASDRALGLGLCQSVQDFIAQLAGSRVHGHFLRRFFHPLPAHLRALPGIRGQFGTGAFRFDDEQLTVGPPPDLVETPSWPAPAHLQHVVRVFLSHVLGSGDFPFGLRHSPLNGRRLLGILGLRQLCFVVRLVFLQALHVITYTLRVVQVFDPLFDGPLLFESVYGFLVCAVEVNTVFLGGILYLTPFFPQLVSCIPFRDELFAFKVLGPSLLLLSTFEKLIPSRFGLLYL